MILLLGGTSETAGLATALAEAGYDVLVSMATDIKLNVGEAPRIQRRRGALDAVAMATLVRERRIAAIVDGAHPYAAELHATAEAVAREAGIPYLAFIRPSGTTFQAVNEHGQDARATFAADHVAAAEIAFGFGRPVLLTSGSHNLKPYATQAQRSGLPLIVRVLPHADSLGACRQAQIPEDRIIAARGPFSVAENRAHLKRFNIGALVTKDSGAAGGVPEKLEAAALENCRVIIVARPPWKTAGACRTPQETVQALRTALGP